jgi:hypothetical protein
MRSGRNMCSAGSFLAGYLRERGKRGFEIGNIKRILDGLYRIFQYLMIKIVKILVIFTEN